MENRDTWYRWNERKIEALFQLVWLPAYKRYRKWIQSNAWCWMKMKKWEVLPKRPVDPESSDFCFHSDNKFVFFVESMYECIYAFLGASKVQRVLSLTLSACSWKPWRLAQSGSVSSLLQSDWQTDWSADRRTGSRREGKGRLRRVSCVFVW